MSAFTSADVTLVRRGKLPHVSESFKFIPWASMADPLDSGDDVSATVELSVELVLPY